MLPSLFSFAEFWESEIAKEAEARMKSTLKQNTASSNLNERSVDPIRTAKEAAKIAMYSAHQVGTALIAAEQRIGELLLSLPTAQGKRTDITSETRSTEVKTKTETISEMGYSCD